MIYVVDSFYVVFQVSAGNKDFGRLLLKYPWILSTGIQENYKEIISFFEMVKVIILTMPEFHTCPLCRQHAYHFMPDQILSFVFIDVICIYSVRGERRLGRWLI